MNETGRWNTDYEGRCSAYLRYTGPDACYS